MKTNSSHRTFQLFWGILMSIAMLSCNLVRPGIQRPSATPGENTAPSGQTSSNPAGSGTAEDGILEMRATAVPATPSQPAWTPQLSPITTKTLTAGQAQVVDVAGKMKLDFPAGAFSAPPPDLVVSTITNDIPVPLPGDELLQAYDVSMGDVHSLAEPLKVTMCYDPTRLKPDLPAGAQIGAAFRDGLSGRWTVGSGLGTYDESSGKLDASLESADTITGLGTDSKGAAVVGSVSVQADFSLLESTETPFTWEITKVSGSSSVDLPASTTRAAFTCHGTVKRVSIYPANYFPLAR